MQAIARVLRSRQGVLTHAAIPPLSSIPLRARVLSRQECVTFSLSPTMQHTGLENTTVKEILKSKGEMDDSLFWCRTTDTVYDAVKCMTQNNIGSLLVLKSGDMNMVAGIITERGDCFVYALNRISKLQSISLPYTPTTLYYLKKIILQERHSKTTKVGEIMTDENKLITVNSDTNILQAMKLMTDNRIRHMPVIDLKIVGMISIVDVVRAVVEQQREEVIRLNDFIKGKYY